MNKTVGIVGLNNAMNFGDPILFKSTQHILNKSHKEIDIYEIDLDVYHKTLIKSVISKGITLIATIMQFLGFKNKEIYYSIINYRNKLIYQDYFKECISNIDFLVFAGGGILKYKYENLDLRVSLLIHLSEKSDIPIYFNAVGVEGYSETDIKCQKLKNKLNNDCVKVITTRDFVNTLEKHYIYNDNILVKKVADPALWVEEVYKVKKHKNSNLIGLGVARYKIFEDNEIEFPKIDQIKFWENLVELLESQGYNWMFYTNGSRADNDFLNELLLQDKLKTFNKRVFIPRNDEELVNFTSRCSKIFSTRLHASIIAYSLQIPSSGIIWNDKITSFALDIGYRERYFYPSELTAEKAFNTIKNMNYGQEDRNRLIEMRKSTADGLHEFLNDYI